MNSQRPIGPLDPFGRIQTHRGSGHYRQFLIHSCTRVPMTLPTPLRPGEAPRFPRPRAIAGRANGGSVAPSADAPSLDDLMAPFSPRATPDAGTADAAHPLDRPRGRMGRVLHEEFQGFHLRLLLLRLVLWPLPMNVGGRLRALAMKLAGFRIGYGTIFAQLPAFTGDGTLYGQLRIGGLCWFNVGCFFDLGAPITIGHNVSFGQQVMVLTSSHAIGPAGRRAAGLVYKPVTIGNGAWLGARCTILPGVSIGDGAIVAAGAIVHQDVPANALVAGVPARIVRSLRVATR